MNGLSLFLIYAGLLGRTQLEAISKAERSSITHGFTIAGGLILITTF